MLDEVAPLERGEAGPRILDRRPFLSAEVRDSARPEDRADHRRVMGELLLVCLQPIEARADQPLDARRHWEVTHRIASPPLELEQSFLPQHPNRLFEKERV